MRELRNLWNEADSNASFLLALLISSKILVIIVERNHIIPIASGLFVYGIIWLLLLVHIVKFRFVISKKSALFLFIISVFIISSNIFVRGHVTELTKDFFEYCLLGYIIGALPLDADKSMKYTSVIFLLLLIPCYILIQSELMSRWQQTITMDLSYAIMPLVIGTLVHTIYYHKIQKMIIKLSHFISIIVAVFISVRGTRGVALSIAFLVFLVFMNQQSRIGKKISIGHMVATLLAILVLLNIDTILVILNNLLSSLNIRISFIQKSVALLLSNNDITNGRLEVYKKALEGFYYSPVWGNGIGVYTDLYPAAKFPHNIVLQALFEGGILFGLPIVYVYIKSAFQVCFGRIVEENKRHIVIALAASTIPASMFSSEYWVYPLLWVMFSIVNSSNHVHFVQEENE